MVGLVPKSWLRNKAFSTAMSIFAWCLVGLFAFNIIHLGEPIGWEFFLVGALAMGLTYYTYTLFRR